MSGCGGGGDEPATTSAAEASAAQAKANARIRIQNQKMKERYEKRQRAAAPNTAESEAAAATASFYEALGAGREAEREGFDPAEIDAESFCGLMSAEALAQTVRYAEVASGIARDWDCEAAVRWLVTRSRQSGGFEDLRSAEVLGVNVAGEKATATVRFGDGVATSVPLVEEDGEWKLAAAAVPR